MVLQGKVGDGITYFNVKNKKAAGNGGLVKEEGGLWIMIVPGSDQKNKARENKYK